MSITSASRILRDALPGKTDPTVLARQIAERRRTGVRSVIEACVLLFQAFKFFEADSSLLAQFRAALVGENVIPRRSAIPIENGSCAYDHLDTIAAALTAGSADILEGIAVRRAGSDGKYTLVVATPHAHVDVSRFSLKYDVVPDWYFYGLDFIADNATFVVSTYPRDLAVIETIFLPSLGFFRPFQIVPVRGGWGEILPPHAEILVIAQRGRVPVVPPHFDHRMLGVLNAFSVARSIDPQVKVIMHLFGQDSVSAQKCRRDCGTHLFCSGSWDPWEAD
jgi:hypothetical protein